jgi:hypothetical protein
VADAFEIAFEVAFHLDGHPVLEQVTPLSQQFRRQRSQALLGILAVGGTTEIQPGVGETMAAGSAFAGGIVFEKLHNASAFWAFGIVNGAFTPILGILSGAFHIGTSFGV